MNNLYDPEKATRGLHQVQRVRSFCNKMHRLRVEKLSTWKTKVARNDKKMY
jgi:hypothetical protein